jgi:hypothetical protein
VTSRRGRFPTSFDNLIALLQHIKLGDILLVQAAIVILIPYLLWRTLRLGRRFPLGVIQILTGVLLGPAMFGAFSPTLFNSLFCAVTIGAALRVLGEAIGTTVAGVGVSILFVKFVASPILNRPIKNEALKAR